MQIHLKVWRQQNRASQGHFADYTLADASPDMSFLEMLDLLNDRLIRQGERPIEFDHDCREGICGQCGVMINGRAHGPLPNTTTCQLRMRTFTDGDIERWFWLVTEDEVHIALSTTIELRSPARR
jgi:succinate dehydrogenase / fumarate reductase, iron-sulfur subunit